MYRFDSANNEKSYAVFSRDPDSALCCDPIAKLQGTEAHRRHESRTLAVELALVLGHRLAWMRRKFDSERPDYQRNIDLLRFSTLHPERFSQDHPESSSYLRPSTPTHQSQTRI